MVSRLNFRMLGNGQPVIILHGLFGMLDNWLTFAKKLEKAGYMPILIDLRDHGKSSHTEDFNYELLAADLYHFMDDNWIHEAILIGHSMGGKVALRFVTDHASMIKKLIVIDIGIKEYAGGHENVFLALNAVDVQKLTSREEAESKLESILHDNSTVQFLMKNLTRTSDGAFKWKMNIGLLQKKYKNILSAITIDHTVHTETLFVRGELSDYISTDEFENIQKVMPNARLKNIMNAGHWVHADQPDELFNNIIDFIRD